MAVWGLKSGGNVMLTQQWETGGMGNEWEEKWVFCMQTHFRTNMLNTSLEQNGHFWNTGCLASYKLPGNTGVF